MAKSLLSYILLGDGDFTYSLDMCRYLAALSDSGDDNKPAISSSIDTHHDVTCTGVDTLKEVKSKYKDADFILTNILSINKRGSSTEDRRITTKIVHGVNAVEPTPPEDNNHPSLQHFDYI